jgi:hypothetical protein
MMATEVTSENFADASTTGEPEQVCFNYPTSRLPLTSLIPLDTYNHDHPRWR